MISFNKIVNKLSKKCGKVIFKNDIFELIDPELKKENNTLVDKTIYKLKSQGVIVSVRNGVYIVPDKLDKNLNEVDLIEKYYYNLLKKYISFTVGASYYISGEKALELHMKNFEIPEKIVVVNRSVNKKILIGNYTIIFKTILSTENQKKINLYSRLSRFTDSIYYNSIQFKVSNIELSLIESGVINDNENGLNISLITKAIKKYGGVFKHDTFREIAKFKYIMSFNRLKELSRNINPSLSALFLDVIKQNGGLFIGEGLRGV
ncbi:MAG: hypothetical protein PHH06_02640 [Candidatus Gracilibacteria bacterium]|nr:hypothetical protein [Candidatus Gracilibacteria bacterium]